MIKSFKHKGLEDFFYDGTKKGIQSKHASKLEDILDLLDAACVVEDMNFPGSKLHPLHGDRQGEWAVKVSGAWRTTFEFRDGDAFLVSYENYH
ncbi:MAG: type II toxin-antitoxin system RelE/ParE family toxin [Thermodesulfobacteriota bacterium]|nr:type II toxin-antitoxin system RelE/ParE family toxin [Thermodesulfobacteriota bacterium]